MMSVSEKFSSGTIKQTKIPSTLTACDLSKIMIADENT